jgi:enoyl-CoA hydratase
MGILRPPLVVKLSPPAGLGDQGAGEISQELVTIERRGNLAMITLERPEVRNAQNGALLYALEAAFYDFAQDDDLAVAVLQGRGTSFSAGHDIGPGADRDVSFSRWSMWPDHVGKSRIEGRLDRECELYLGLCRRWREIPKPTIAMVRGACVAGGLMLAWSCDLVLADEDAFFADPTVAMGVPGMEYFVHPWVMGSRQAKEFLFTGRRVSASEALSLGMINHVYSPDDLERETIELARRISAMPRFGLSLAKMAVNRCEDAMGMTNGMDSVFGLHQLGHAHNDETTGSAVANQDPMSIKRVMAD